jgi:DNA-binding IclR family transcriptional regulator
VRHVGYAISDGEIEVGPKAIAVPLMKNRNEVIAALSIEAPRTRMTDEAVSDYVELLMREAALIQQEHR